MNLTLSIISHIRRAKHNEPKTRISHFQFRIVNGCPVLIDLRNGHVRLLSDTRPVYELKN